MRTPDYLVMGLVLALLFVVSASLMRRASKSSSEFILAGRKMPWWLAGISIAAGQLNANNVLQDTRKAREDGIGGMWFNWTQIISTAIGAAWFFRLWRRARFTTPMDFYLARYTGWPAHTARMFDTVIFGGGLSLIWAALGLIGMKKVLHVLFALPASVHWLGLGLPTDWLIVAGLVALGLLFTVLSGVHGVVWTDLVEFIVAMTATYTLLFFVLRDVGWGAGLRRQLMAGVHPNADWLRMFPPLGFVFLYYLIIGPILGQGGWSPAVQRMLCVSDERGVVYSAISNAIFTFAIRGVPFVIIGLCAVVLVPDRTLLASFPPLLMPDGAALPDRERIYPLLALRYLPTGILGLSVASFLCGFITSLTTNIHNSAAVFTNDLYRPYLRPGRSDRHYVKAARWYIAIAGVITVGIGISFSNILFISMLTVAVITAAGFVKCLRFVWWRINGASEVAAKVATLGGIAFSLTPPGGRAIVWLAQLMHISGNDGFFVARQVGLIGIATLTALITLALTPPEPLAKLESFYELVRPFGWWGPVRARESAVRIDSIGCQFLLMFAILGVIAGALFATLFFFLGLWWPAAVAAIVGLAGWITVGKSLDRIDAKTSR